MKFDYRVIDAFTDQPFAGNPAAVVVLERWPADAWLQNVAMEMNLSETAFLVRRVDGYDLRWFTPNTEVDLCGHATLAAALALRDEAMLSDGADVCFHTRSGRLTVLRVGDEFQLDFPVLPAQICDAPPGLIASLDVQPLRVARNRFDFLIELASAEHVRRVSPNFSELARVECRGVIVTAQDESGRFDFVSRFFAPASGIDEDPVTGSAHCCLADYWSGPTGKKLMTGYQASHRGGVVQVELAGERVLLRGRGVVFARGSFWA